MASPVGHVLTLADDILAEILIVLPTLADIGLACASCPAFRRVITGHAFLRRLHALHPPLLLGFHTLSGGFQPVESPHPSAPVARAIAGAADLSFSFLPSLGYWMVRDARDGRFLLDCDERKNKTFTTIAVCDPLFRRYVLLPPMPQDLATTVDQPNLVNGERKCDIFFAPCGEGEDPESFRVIWMAQCSTKLVAFIFSSAKRQWRAIASPSWRDLNPEMPSMTEHRSLSCRNYAYGRFYWLLSNFPRRSKLLVLDMGRMEFSLINPPFGVRVQEFAIVELHENRLGMLASNCVEGSRLKFFCADRQNHGEEIYEWVFQKKVSLDPSYLYYMLGVVDGQLLLQRTPNACDAAEFGCISLDLKTFQIHWLRGMLKSGYRPLPTLYTGYPPSLSLPIL
ncbi:hypothetical protein HU200_054617 [Digitaria exilis]|uniref:F-box protein AT5G49610-like beta-propeller domain-containing protein n=1 Tax=Digitaria exilis TaxID=1010633 RepID=A0A835AKF2_9POAL|nr:hypothetical protein HU200_054617 [Digitaria exilis]